VLAVSSVNAEMQNYVSMAWAPNEA